MFHPSINFLTWQVSMATLTRSDASFSAINRFFGFASSASRFYAASTNRFRRRLRLLRLGIVMAASLAMALIGVVLQATTPFVRSVLWTVWAIISSTFVIPVILTFYLPFLGGVGVMAGSGCGFVVGTIVWFASAAIKAEDGGIVAFAENCVNDAVVIKALASSMSVSGVVAALMSYAVKRISVTAMTKEAEEEYEDVTDNYN